MYIYIYINVYENVCENLYIKIYLIRPSDKYQYLLIIQYYKI